MNDKKFNDDIVEIEEYIRYLDWKIRLKGRTILADEDITPLQFYALQMIKYQNGKATPKYLTNLLKIAPSTVSDMIRKMEETGYIKKEVTEYDKRSFYIDVTNKGNRVIDDVIEERHKFLQKCLADESDQEIEKIREGLKYLYEVLKKQ